MECLYVEKSDNSTSKRSPLLGRQNTIAAQSGNQSMDTRGDTSQALNSNNASYNIRLFTTASTSTPAPSPTPVVALAPQIAITAPVARSLFPSPKTAAASKGTFHAPPHAMAPTSSAVQSASASLMMHFKNLVNVS
ncbi:unnamed protein product [Gongylonema pulchrum]|uniref:Uncharacterized protein n=1 Tax=Gongylonema pulchrum TaxID=637853 RepID=A0A3P7R043_9BILA|nr:unnamed protein product [Gongylonema pulchrum]